MKIYWHNGSKNIIGKRVREARLKANPQITQQDLSARLEVLGYNIDRVSISKIESGDRFVADYEVVGLATALNVNIDWLLSDLK
ncbi:helix-turn-helix protein [Anaerobacterium chartisolvens]|uniref:Helix-turn-helix protein n=1 Tax=Anaerobacterium chartisolvens TaxID=1297424 RepID=A0A369AV17_9FIRM|nr:helix-turn-helix transcriptional regulator [Anaerobacterium chartisolvens]RCX12096.1 helix-turn-helix protein [Anaerobacterium chartisolvens]